MKKILIIVVFLAGLLSFACARFRNAPATTTEARYVVISPIYNEIIWALGAQTKSLGSISQQRILRKRKRCQT